VNSVSGRSLRAFHLFRSLPDTILNELSPHVSWVEYREGDHLWHTGDPSTHFVFIARGLVQVVRLSARGAQSTLAIFGPGEGIGNVAAMEHSPYPASVEVLSDTLVVAKIPADILLAASRKHPELMEANNRSLLGNIRILQAKMDVLCAGPVAARMALLLLHLAERFGDETLEGGTFIPLALTRGCVARLVGAREETVIRILSQWKKTGLLLTDAEGIHIPVLKAFEDVVLDEGLGAD